MAKKEVEQIIREIAIEEKVDPELAVCVAKCESGLNPNAKNKNKDAHKSIDRGLFQFNSYWHKEVTDTMAFNPRIATKLFCRAVKKGFLSYWNSSKSCWNRGGRFDTYTKKVEADFS